MANHSESRDQYISVPTNIDGAETEEELNEALRLRYKRMSSAKDPKVTIKQNLDIIVVILVLASLLLLVAIFAFVAYFTSLEQQSAHKGRANYNNLSHNGTYSSGIQKIDASFNLTNINFSIGEIDKTDSNSVDETQVKIKTSGKDVNIISETTDTTTMAIGTNKPSINDSNNASHIIENGSYKKNKTMNYINDTADFSSISDTNGSSTASNTTYPIDMKRDETTTAIYTSSTTENVISHVPETIKAITDSITTQTPSTLDRSLFDITTPEVYNVTEQGDVDNDINIESNRNTTTSSTVINTIGSGVEINNDTENLNDGKGAIAYPNITTTATESDKLNTQEEKSDNITEHSKSDNSTITPLTVTNYSASVNDNITEQSKTDNNFTTTSYLSSASEINNVTDIYNVTDIHNVTEPFTVGASATPNITHTFTEGEESDAKGTGIHNATEQLEPDKDMTTIPTVAITTEHDTPAITEEEIYHVTDSVTSVNDISTKPSIKDVTDFSDYEDVISSWNSLYLPKMIHPVHYDLHLDIFVLSTSGACLDSGLYTGSVTMTIRVLNKTDFIVFHANDIRLNAYRIHFHQNNESISQHVEDVTYNHAFEYYVIKFTDFLGAGFYDVTIPNFMGCITTSSGLFLSSYETPRGETR